MKFILQCIQDELSEFRLPELLSVAKLFNFEITFESIDDINLVCPVPLALPRILLIRIFIDSVHM